MQVTLDVSEHPSARGGDSAPVRADSFWWLRAPIGHRGENTPMRVDGSQWLRAPISLRGDNMRVVI